MKHIPVLLEETISVLALQSESTVIDCTLGGGGHARAILEQIGPRGTYVGIDADPRAIEMADELRKSAATVHLVKDNFRSIKRIIEDLGVKPDAILADLGWRSDQFETGGKGFSFNSDDPLLMTFGDPTDHVFTASDIVNEWEESSISDVLYGYGEEKRARRIAHAIVAARAHGPIKTARELSDIVVAATPAFARHGKIHPATRTFQAIRIAVNDELGALTDLLRDGFEILGPQGRLAIISFHSLEDRLVKRFMKEKIDEGKALRLIKKPITASADEREENPRSRSAKLRVIEKI